jgi:hypothetical protein
MTTDAEPIEASSQGRESKSREYGAGSDRRRVLRAAQRLKHVLPLEANRRFLREDDPELEVIE